MEKNYRFNISFQLGSADHLDQMLVSNWLRNEIMTGSLAGIGSPPGDSFGETRWWLACQASRMRLDGPLDCSFQICLHNQTPQAYLEQLLDDLVEHTGRLAVQLEASYFCYEEVPLHSLKIQRDFSEESK